LMTANTAAQESSRPSPPSLVVTPLTGIEVSGLQGGPFSPAAFQYRVSASSGTIGTPLLLHRGSRPIQGSTLPIRAALSSR
jgi:hypothetical protein